MSHLIEQQRDFAYMGQAPWHGIGIYHDPITRKFLEQETNFCHHVDKLPYKFQDDCTSKNAFYLQVGDRVIRETIGNRYNVLQTSEMLDITEPLMETFHVETAGVLEGGSKVFITFKLNEQTRLKNGDVIDNYILFTDSRDGSTPYFGYTPIRVVCYNTLMAALKGSKMQAFRHTSGIKNRISDAITAMGLIVDFVPKAEKVFSSLLDKEINMVQMVGDLYLQPQARKELITDGTLATKTANTMRELLAAYSSGVGQEADGSGWMAYNGVTNFYNYKEYKPRNYSSVEGRRMDGMLYGSEAAAMKKAFEYCLVPQQVNREFVSKLENALYDN